MHVDEANPDGFGDHSSILDVACSSPKLHVVSDVSSNLGEHYKQTRFFCSNRQHKPENSEVLRRTACCHLHLCLQF